MDRTDDERRARRRPLSFLAAIGLMVSMSAVVAPSANAVANTCRARDVTRGTPASSNLQRVIRDAHAGDRIAVKYVCVGNFKIGKALTLVGKATAKLATGVLNGNGTGRTLTVSARVKLINLRLSGGHVDGLDCPAACGGGIFNSGALVLNDSVVSRNSSVNSGGGIYNIGTLTLRGSSVVAANTSDQFGGGIYNYNGTLNLEGTTKLSGNDAGIYGGGILNDIGTVSLHDLTYVTGNTASDGGGIFNGDVLTVADSSEVYGNTASHDGGGMYNYWGTLTLRNLASITGNTAAHMGGGLRSLVAFYACDNAGLDEWGGSLSPNSPNDAPTASSTTCS